MGLTFGSLFAGIGGFDLGFERAGMACRWQVEIDNYARKVLAKHWPAVHRERDIRQCGRHNLEPVDVICGGFPCQDISYAGAGAGLAGERSGLFFEAVRVVRELRPKAVVLENVAALLTRGLDKVLGTLAEIGYDAEWHCIPAAAVGAPHIRDRLFVLAYAEHAGLEGGRRAARIGATMRHSAGIRRFKPQSHKGKADEIHGGSAGRETIWNGKHSICRVADGVPNRVDRLRGLGNAVVPQVAEFIGRQIVQHMTGGNDDAENIHANPQTRRARAGPDGY